MQKIIREENLRGAKGSNGLTIDIMPYNELDKFSKYVDKPSTLIINHFDSVIYCRKINKLN